MKADIDRQANLMANLAPIRSLARTATKFRIQRFLADVIYEPASGRK